MSQVRSTPVQKPADDRYTDPQEPVRRAIESLRDDKSQLVGLDLAGHYSPRDRAFHVEAVDVESIDDSDDPRETVRMVTLLGRMGKPALRYALELTVSPDHHAHYARCLASSNRLEADETYPINEITVTTPDHKWILIKQGNTRRRFHRPHPVAITQGEARPACGAPSADEPSTYRVLTRQTVAGRLYPCKDCFVHQPANTETVTCPRCETALTTLAVAGQAPSALEGVRADCPSCPYSGVIARDD